jgi:hypothetical protein
LRNVGRKIALRDIFLGREMALGQIASLSYQHPVYDDVLSDRAFYGLRLFCVAGTTNTKIFINHYRDYRVAGNDYR